MSDTPTRAVKVLIDQVRDLAGDAGLDVDAIDDLDAAAFIRAADRTRETSRVVIVERTIQYRVEVALPGSPTDADFENEAHDRIAKAEPPVLAEYTVADDRVAWIQTEPPTDPTAGGQQ